MNLLIGIRDIIDVRYISRFKNKLDKGNKKILESFSYLTLIQIFNMLMPLITYPYLVRILGAELYGTIVFVQAIVGYFSIIINFGFNISATKEIAGNRDNLEKISEITSSVFILQFFLWVMCLCVFIIFIVFIPLNYNTQLLFLFTFGMTFNELLFPVWFFQGIEKMKFITYINLLTKVVFLCLVFLFVNKQSDYILVPLFYTVTYILCGIVSFSIIMTKYKVKIRYYPYKILVYYFRSSLYLFISKLALLIKDRSMIVLLGLLFSKSVVAYYDLALKLVNLYTALYQSIPTAILPRLMQQKNYKIARFLFLFTVSISVLYYLFLLFFSDWIIHILAGSLFNDAKFYLMIVGSLVVVNPLNTLLNYYLILSNEEALVLRSVSVSFITFCCFLCIGWFIDSIILLLLSMVISGLFETLYKLFLFRREKELWRFIQD